MNKNRENGKLIYDVDGVEGSRGGGSCPKFVLYENLDLVTLVDRRGKRANMKISEFNQIVNAIKQGEIKEIKSIKR